LGPLEGQPKRQLWRLLLSDRAEEPGIWPDGTEPMHLLGDRVMDFITDVKDKHPGQTVAAFSHFGPLCAVLHLHKGASFRQCVRSLAPGAATLLRLDDAGSANTRVFTDIQDLAAAAPQFYLA
jgi:broad specificity phosphatase PhoE